MNVILVLALVFGPPLAAASNTGFQTGVVSAPDNVPIHYSTYGSGSPALVFVHGISCDQSYWREQVGPFARDFLVVTVDLAGHGESGLGRKEWSMEAYGADVAAVVADLDLQRVVLIGHSMGGTVILEAARQLPDLVNGVVIVDTFGSFDSWWTADEIEQFLSPFREDFTDATREWVQWMFNEDPDPSFVEQVVTGISSAPPEVAIPSLEAAIEKAYGPQVQAALDGLSAPVFMINSDFAPSDVESLERHGAEVHIIPNTGHFLMLEDSAAFNEVLSIVLQRINAPDPSDPATAKN